MSARLRLLAESLRVEATRLDSEGAQLVKAGNVSVGLSFLAAAATKRIDADRIVAELELEDLVEQVMRSVHS